MRNLTRSMAAIALLSIASMAMAQVSELYPQPFPGTINSTFGPRVTETEDKKNYTPGFHGGLDFLQGAGTSIPAAADGYVEDILTNYNESGIRLWLKTKDKIDLGYLHLFSYNDPTHKNRSGTFVLLRDQPYYWQYDPHADLIVGRNNYKYCNTILNTESSIALVPKKCAYMEGTKLHLDPQNPNRLYTVTNKVKAGSWIAPVGFSSSVVIGPHLHLQRGKKGNTRHPLGIFSPIKDVGNFCARLGDANTNPPFADALNCGSTAKVPPYDLTTRPYIDVRVDATNRLDLDGAAFGISGTPIQQYSVLFGPPAVNGELMKDTKEMVSDVVRKPNCSENQIPQSGDLLICANHWKGQPSRFERVFRLGVDPAAVPKGCNSVDVKLIRAAQEATENFKLNFKNGEDKPKAVNDVASTKINTPVTIAIKSNDTNASGNPLPPDVAVTDVTLADLSKGSVTSNQDGTITFTPASGVTGIVSINYRLTTPCGDKSDVATVMVTVTIATTSHWAGSYIVDSATLCTGCNCSWESPSGSAWPRSDVSAGSASFYFDDETSDVIFEHPYKMRTVLPLGWRSSDASLHFSVSTHFHYTVPTMLPDPVSGDYLIREIDESGSRMMLFAVTARTEDTISGTFTVSTTSGYFQHCQEWFENWQTVTTYAYGTWSAIRTAGPKPSTTMNGHAYCAKSCRTGVDCGFSYCGMDPNCNGDYWVPNTCNYD